MLQSKLHQALQLLLSLPLSLPKRITLPLLIITIQLTTRLIIMSHQFMTYTRLNIITVKYLMRQELLVIMDKKSIMIPHS